jgi:hypothetical protein
MKNQSNLLKITIFALFFNLTYACKKEDKIAKVTYFLTTTTSSKYPAFEFFFESLQTKVVVGTDTSFIDSKIQPKTINFSSDLVTLTDTFPSFGVSELGDKQVIAHEFMFSKVKVAKYPNTEFKQNVSSIGIATSSTLIAPNPCLDYEVTFEINIDESVIELPSGALQFVPKIKTTIATK